MNGHMGNTEKEAAGQNWKHNLDQICRSELITVSQAYDKMSQI